MRFQYIRISGLAKAPEEVTGYLIHTDYKDASSFECSDPDLNAIYAMIKYTFKNLAFSGYIVDCPHYERMGYGGDGNASCKSFQTLYEGSSVYMNWMQMWQDCSVRMGDAALRTESIPGGRWSVLVWLYYHGIVADLFELWG